MPAALPPGVARGATTGVLPVDGDDVTRDWLSSFAGGRAIDLVLAFVVLEGLVLFAVWRIGGRGLRPREIVTALVPGACLMLALRAALEQQSGLAIAGWLLAALVSHLTDLAFRWRA